MKDRVILDLCGGTGSWSKPYSDNGYNVILYDLPNDIRMLEFNNGLNVYGILCAPPCTIFSYARQRYGMPYDHEIKEAISIVDACLRAVIVYRPKFWALENPRNKLRRYLGDPKITFKQHWFGDGQEKPTCLWGCFNFPKFNHGKRTKPSTFKTKKQNADKKDAITHAGFAKAFYEANK